MVTGTEKMTKQLFESIDNQDAEAFLAFLSDDVKFRFGNAALVTGKSAVGEAVSGFFPASRQFITDSLKPGPRRVASSVMAQLHTPVMIRRH